MRSPFFLLVAHLLGVAAAARALEALGRWVRYFHIPLSSGWWAARKGGILRWAVATSNEG